MVLSSCCGVGSLRTGTLIIGALDLVLALLVLPLAGWCASDTSVSAKMSLCRICFVELSYGYARFRPLKVTMILINCAGSGEAVLRPDQARLEE